MAARARGQGEESPARPGALSLRNAARGSASAPAGLGAAIQAAAWRCRHPHCQDHPSFNRPWLCRPLQGKYAKGAVWVASRVPDGYVGATANQARTTTFRQDDPANVLFSADVVTFAQVNMNRTVTRVVVWQRVSSRVARAVYKQARRRASPSTATPQSIGAYPAGAPASAFNFREAYDPISFSGARFAEARVWSLLNPACGGCLDTHLDFAQVRSAECEEGIGDAADGHWKCAASSLFEALEWNGSGDGVGLPRRVTPRTNAPAFVATRPSVRASRVLRSPIASRRAITSTTRCPCLCPSSPSSR